NCLLSKNEKTLDSLKNLARIGLNAQEIEFVRSTYMDNSEAKKVGELAKKLDIKLSTHASYFINLASKERKKIEISRKRILSSCERMHYMGGGPVVFHPSYFGGMDREKVFQTTKEAILDMMNTIKKKGWNCKLAPETTGKHSALGSLDETIRMVKETGCFLCVDLAHLFARNLGRIDFGEIFNKLKPLKLKHLHCHFSGIEYTSKGEKRHLVLNHSPEFKEFAKVLLKQKWLKSVTIISESPITWKDSLKMKKILEKMGYRFK
ncbi:MAG: TIM barrel protein, partial [Candidatus Aenigmatarchaeota archaeon]